MSKKPIWIILDDGETFEGHQGHFEECFFSNASESIICAWAERENFKTEITPMTEEQLKKYPEAVQIAKDIFNEYGD